MKTKSLLALLSVGLCLMVQPAASGEYDEGVAFLRSTQYAVALRLWQPLAEHGDARAQNQLGFLYLKGFGVNQDYAEAARWFRLAADQGFAGSEFYLGVMYEDGLGVGQDYAQAVKWYLLAATEGDIFAQGKLGNMYAHGQGVPQDYVKAQMWFNLAIDGFPTSVTKFRDGATRACRHLSHVSAQAR